MTTTLLLLLFLLIPFVYSSQQLEGDIPGTQIFEMSSLCKGHYPSMHRKIDAAVIHSNNDKNLDCVVTFSAEYVSQRFLIRFVQWNMECGDRLHIYDSANAIGSSRAELSCRFLGPDSIIPIRTRGHYVTLRFTADNWGTEGNKFTMIITAFKDPSQGCRDAFVCGDDSSRMCITNRLLCDNVENCIDGADENRSANCTSNIFDVLNSFELSWRLGLVGGGVMGGAVMCFACFFCLCSSSRRTNSTPNQSPDIYNHGKAGGSNGHPQQHESRLINSLRKSENRNLLAVCGCMKGTLFHHLYSTAN